MRNRKISNRIRDFFTLILKDPEKKSTTGILSDFIKYNLINKNIAEQYFSKFLYRQENQNHKDYLVTHDIQEKCWSLNNENYVSILDDKYLFEIFFSMHNLSVVKSIGRNINSLFFLPDEVRQINNSTEFINFMAELFGDSKKPRRIFVKKTAGSGGGRNIYRISADDLVSDRSMVEEIYNRIIESEYIFQYDIIQHEAISSLNSYCLNTLRIDTYTNKDNQSYIMSGYFRVGLNKSHVDNVSSGGAYIGVNVLNGTLYAEAISDFTNGKGITHRFHPENKMKFEGFQIPFYDEIKELVLIATQKVPQLRVIGWDIALMPDGPILIEGNELPSLVFSEIGQKGFRKNPVFMELYNELKGR